ncbi:cytochrome P450 [Colletotrichum caudatum]|nr:cytochrome P450 [Colletotrichum caudatum]
MTNTSYSVSPDGPAPYSFWVSSVAGVVFAAFLLISQVWFKSSSLNLIPTVGKGSRWARRKHFMQGNATQMFLDAYRNYKDSIAMITTAKTRDSILVPPKYLSELSKAPDDVISARKAVEEFIQSKYTTVGYELPIFVHVSRANLTPALNDLNPAVADTIAKTIPRELTPTADWNEVAINAKLLRIIAIASSHVFVAVYGIAAIPTSLRPLIAPWLPMTRALHKRLAEADAVFQHIVTDRQEASKEGPLKHNDMLQWMLEAQTRVGELSTRDLALAQLGASFAAIHTTTMTATNVIYWLAAKPEFYPMLREEIEQVLAESGGRFTTSALQNMKKTDSFIRLYSPQFPEANTFALVVTGSYVRKVLKPYQLSNGQTIPEGTSVEVPSVGVYQVPDIYPNPNVFDALRFYKLRNEDDPAQINQLQAAYVGVTNLGFSFGKHACPGRVLAVNEIMMVLATLLRNYDIKLPDGVSDRYANLVMADQNVPDPSKTILIKQR